MLILTRRANAQGPLKEYFNRAILGPKLLVVDEIGYLPFRREAERKRTCSSTWSPSDMNTAAWCGLVESPWRGLRQTHETLLDVTEADKRVDRG
jgi:hypothetical protein